MPKLIPIEKIQNSILIIRGEKVILDADLANLYGVSTKRLNEQVKRNRKRFPKDFIFQLSKRERDEVVANCDHLQKLKFSPVLPYAFTEHGTLMVSSILNTAMAIRTGIYIVRVFVRLRQLLATHKDLMYKLFDVETRISKHDEHIQSLWDTLEKLMNPPEEKYPTVRGFKSKR